MTYCKCGTRVNATVREYKDGRLIWVSCIDCYVKKKKLEKQKSSKSEVMTYHGADPQN